MYQRSSSDMIIFRIMWKLEFSYGSDMPINLYCGFVDVTLFVTYL